jgi:hypothetical protein
MLTLLKHLFIENWQRKAICLVLAIVIWLTVNHSLTKTKTLNNVPIRVINLPHGKTIDGIHGDGILSKKITLTLTGKKALLDQLSSSDVEVLIDASDKPDEWIANIGKKNLISINPDQNVHQGISSIAYDRFIIRLTNLVTEKIPVIISQPIGEAPKGYQFLDIWPYRLNLTVSGPEEIIQRLKLQGQKLTFNLNNISKAELDAIASKMNSSKGEEVSYFVPDQWKQISFPALSDIPLEIDDTQAKFLRIDFVRSELIPIEIPIPLSLFFPQEYTSTLNPDTVVIKKNKLVQEINGIHLLEKPLYAKGVSHLFVQHIRNMIEMVITVNPRTEANQLEWSMQFINAKNIEDHYVTTVMSDSSDEDINNMHPSLREEYLRNRFRNYMNRFQLYNANDTRFALQIELKDGTILLNEPTAP